MSLERSSCDDLTNVGTTDTIEPNTLIARNARVAFHALAEGEGGVLLHLDTGAYHGVNQVGLLVWQLLEERRQFEQLVALFSARVEGAPPTLADEISGYVNDLGARDLVTLTCPAN